MMAPAEGLLRGIRVTSFRFAIVICLVLVLAEARGSPVRAEEDPAFVALGPGYFYIDDHGGNDKELRLEYRHGRGLWIFRPWVGIEVTGKGGVYGVGGFLADLSIGPRLVITPSLGVGGYAQGSGVDLGHIVEFRSQIEVAYRFDDRSRLGLAFGHISNANLSEFNPGSEILTLYYNIPLDRILGPNLGM